MHSSGPIPRLRSNPGAKILDEDVSLADHIENSRTVTTQTQVKRQMVVATAKQGGIESRVPSWAARRIDPNHVCSVIGEDHGCERAGQVLTEIKYFHSVQRQGGTHRTAVANR